MAWYNASWTYRVKVTVLASKVDADLTDFPVYVDLSDLPADFHTNVGTGAVDIRVTTSDGTTEVPREIVFYTNATDTGELYFKGNLLNASDVDFYIYYGNGAASDYAAGDTYGRNNVWKSTYKAVYHLGDGTTLSTTDSTSNANNLTNTSSVAIAGKVEGGVDFNATADLSKTSPTGLSTTFPVAMQFWANPDTVAGYQYFAQASVYGGANHILSLANEPAGKLYYFQGAAARLTSTYTLPTATWTLLTLVFVDASTVVFYANGVSQTIAQPVGAWALGAAVIRLGELDGSSNGLNGKMDEVRFLNENVASTWVSTDYNNQNSPSTFFTIGTQEEEVSAPILNDIQSISNISSITF